MNIQKYLNRIKYYSEVETSKEVMFGLQKQHLLNIPFENLDIHYGTKIELDLKKIFQKIIIEKRGGFCYELNSLFNELLKEIGFNTFLISGRVYNENGTYGQEFDHMAIIVMLENKSYLVDVGFGRFILEPLEIVMDKPQIDNCGTFIIDKIVDDNYRVNKLEIEKRIPEYIFNLNKRQLTEFKEMCDFHQSSQESHFTKNKVISIAETNGRISLTNKTLKITKGDKTKTIEFEKSEFENYLNKYFNIQIEKTTNR